QLPQHGIEPAVLCLKDEGPLAAECRRAGVPVHSKLLHNKYDAMTVHRISRLTTQPGSVVVAVGSGGDRMFWSVLAAAAARVPLLVWSHWCPTEREQRFERVNRLLYRRVDRFIALGRRHGAALARWEHVPAGRITTIHNGIDLSRFEQRHKREEARRVLGLA